MTRDEVLVFYDQAVDQCEAFQRKGKTMPYTSANGHMFSQVNKDGQLGIRFSKSVKETYLDDLNTSVFKSYGAVMKGYIIIPESIIKDELKLIEMLIEGYEYVMTLDPK